MLIKFRYKNYELDLQKIAKHAVDLQGVSLSLKTSLIVLGDISLAILCDSVASACILLQCIKTELSLFRSFSKLKYLRCR